MKAVKIDAYEEVKKSVHSNWSRYVSSLNNICVFWLVLYLLCGNASCPCCFAGHFSVTLQSLQLLKTILVSLTMLS